MKNKETTLTGDMGVIEEVYDKMLEIITTYGKVTVAEYNYILGKEAMFQDSKKGWTIDEINDIEVTTVNRGGRLAFQLILPEPMIFDNEEESKEDENEK